MLFEVLGQAESAREADGFWISPDRDPVDMRAPGVREAEQARDLVECLASRIIDGLAEHLDIGNEIPNEQERGVTAGDQEGDRRQL